MTTTLHRLRQMKQQGQRFACITAYDASFAWLAATAGIEVLLVGDSLGMVVQGQSSTLPVTLTEMAYHTACVARANSSSLIMADLPFMTYSDERQALDSAAQLMRAGAHLVKLEGGAWLAPSVEHLRRNGIPVCAHMGLTPQSVHVFGGYRVQGRGSEAGQRLLSEARTLVAAGADLLLLECVPRDLAAMITQAVEIPVIGIGAGPDTDAQVLVMHDLLGIDRGHKPARLVKNFLHGEDGILGAFRAYAAAVRDGSYPSDEHCFSQNA